MTDEKAVIDDGSLITHNSKAYGELLAELQQIEWYANKIMFETEPALCGERYLTTAQVMERFHISRRALQNYRDRGIIPYTSIGNILLYPESQINEVLERNYYKPTVFGE